MTTLEKLRGGHGLYAALALTLLCCACAEQRKAMTISALGVREDVVVEPTTRKEAARAATIEARRVALDALKNDSRHPPEYFKKSSMAAKPVRLGDSDHVPDVWLFAIWRNASGRVDMAVEIPYSESGDWHLEYTHYFDEAGRTIAFRRFSGFFNPPLKELSLDCFDPQGRLIKKSYALTDHDDKVAAKADDKDFSDRHEYLIYPSWEAMAKGSGLPLSR